MPFVETYYDYEIHKKCFRVSDSAGYTHTTDTLLKNTSVTSVYRNYFTAVFSLDVIRNLGDSKVGIYDNDTLLDLITFNEQTNKITNLSYNLAYGVEHNLEARYMGNEDCLPSKSMVIPLYQPLPSGFESQIMFIHESTPIDGTEYNLVNPEDGSQIMGLLLRDDENTAIRGADVSLILDGEEENMMTDTTNNSGYVQFTLGSMEFGIHTLKAIYEGDSTYIGVEADLTWYFGIQTNVTVSKIIAGQKPKFNVHVEDYKNNGVSSKAMSLWRG